jgi:hypothetical protein
MRADGPLRQVIRLLRRQGAGRSPLTAKKDGGFASTVLYY